jgi:hypothetical protein
VKGLVEPVEAFELVGASTLRRRLQVAAVRGLTRFVGRHPELAALQQALERTGTGHGDTLVETGDLVGDRGAYRLAQVKREPWPAESSWSMLSPCGVLGRIQL